MQVQKGQEGCPIPVAPLKRKVLANALSIYPDRWRQISEMKFIVLVTTPDNPFITSDRPISLCNPAKLKADLDSRLEDEGSRLTIPLSTTLCLQACRMFRINGYMDSKREWVECMNRIVINQAVDMIIASSPNFPGSDGIDEWLKR